MEHSFLSAWLSFPPSLKTLAADALAISMEPPMGNARDAAEERRLRRKGENAKVRAPRRRPSSFGCQTSSLKSVPHQTSSISRCAGAGHSFFFSTQLKYEKNIAYCGSQAPLYLFNPCRLGAVSGVLCEKFESTEHPVDPAAKVAWVGNCIISVWIAQTGFRISEGSLQTVFCIPGSGISPAVPLSTTEKCSSVSGASSHQEY